jgi:ferritin-like metal-binding protein YciE
MEIDQLKELYVDELRDLLSAENQIVKALPKMAKKAASPQLRQAFEEHLEQSKGHVERLQQIFANMDLSARAKTCKGMQGIMAEGTELMEEVDEPALDAALISAAQKVEHYEMASYGTVRAYARLLGDEKAARLLQQTLDEEGETDKKLTKLAESGINVEAVQA